MGPRFWAKTGAGKFDEQGQPQYHPVICHLADTAAVAMEILRNHLSPIALEKLAAGLCLEEDSVIRFCGFMAGSHDLGKVSPAFQFKVSEVGKALVGKTLYDCWSRLPPVRQSGKAPHGTITAATLPGFLVEIGVGKGLAKRRRVGKLARRLAALVGGHHGFFPSQQDIEALDGAITGTDERSTWRTYSRTIFQQLHDFVELRPEDLPDQCDNAAAMILAGLTTVSDWLASNPSENSGFPYANDTPFDQYAKSLGDKASRALESQGFWQLPKGNPLEFRELFSFIEQPRPLQNSAIQLSKELTAPCLVIAEASMGEGKTEAALYLADCLQHQSGCGGFYIGLPTQATSNAMFQRVQDFLVKRYRDHVHQINLTLSHSAAVLKEDYQNTICRLEQIYDQERPSVVASEWHTARKRTLLSPYGVGTLDQGLMGVVRSRHQFVRLFGLAGRTIILDEIHAYDLYTSTLLERFLEWAAVLGSPVIALSATLPSSTRKRLLDAYAKGKGCSDFPHASGGAPGCGDEEKLALPTAPYPRITALAASGPISRSFEASDHVRRSLLIDWISEEEWGAKLKAALVDGGCAAVICSTVNRAQEVFQRLQLQFTKQELGLFHGRFLFRDRERIEKDCLSKFGKGDEHRPNRFVLVATQVIEQSLDVDFDLMISDIAPIDLLLQRSGRLHRHIRDRRPTQLQNPALWIIEPTIDTEGKADFNESSYIYDRHVLLRTWLCLRQRHQVQLPHEMDGLIEFVYDLDMPIPENLEPQHDEDWQASRETYKFEEEERKKAIANQVKLPPPSSKADPDEFTRQGEEDDESAIAAVTRLGEPSITTIFLQRTEGGLVLPGTQTPVNLEATPKLEQIRELLAYSTRLSKKGLVRELCNQKPPTTWRSALLRNCRYVEVDSEGSAVVGKWRLTLDPLRGVLIERDSKSEF